MRPLWRNMPRVWREDGANKKSDGWNRPALLAYDSYRWGSIDRAQGVTTIRFGVLKTLVVLES